MKRIFSILLIFLTINAFSQKRKTKVIEGGHRCASTSPPIDHPLNHKDSIPIWNDERLDGRQVEIIQEGVYRALKKMACSISDESNFILYYDFFTGLNLPLYEGILDYAYKRNQEQSFHSRTTTDPIFRLFTYNRDGFSGYIDSSTRVMLSVYYRKFTGGSNFLARMTPEIKQTTCNWMLSAKEFKKRHPEYLFYPECSCKGSWHSQTYFNDDESLCISEDLNVNIEIFDLVFKDKKLWIPSREKWAETPLAAIVYLFTHEMGHVEAFLYKSSEYNKYRNNGYAFISNPIMHPFDDTEDAAWDYASSILVYICE